MEKHTEWEWEIKARQGWFDLHLQDLFEYKDLLLRFVRRDLLASYQQTLLGPLWVFLQPFLSTLVFVLIFSVIAHLPTEGIPAILFYLPGTIIWGYFSDCLQSTMNTFVHNANLFSKVWFPRLIAPLSLIIFHSIRLSVQLLLFFIVCLFYHFTDHALHLSWMVMMLPVLILITTAFAFGGGLILSVCTAKYRDLENIMQFLLRLFMFATPVVFPMSMVPEKLKIFFWINPLTAVLETFRSAFFSNQGIPLQYLLVSASVSFSVLLTGLILFRRHEIKAMDIV